MDIIDQPIILQLTLTSKIYNHGPSPSYCKMMFFWQGIFKICRCLASARVPQVNKAAQFFRNVGAALITSDLRKAEWSER